MLFRKENRLSKYERQLKETFPYDPEKQEPVVRCSICTGEQAAGFLDRANGRFTEYMLIRDQRDLEQFRKICGAAEIRRIY